VGAGPDLLPKSGSLRVQLSNVLNAVAALLIIKPMSPLIQTLSYFGEGVHLSMPSSKDRGILPRRLEILTLLHLNAMGLQTL
jgi:hypothetical protein